MGRIEKIKRQLIEEANKRLLGEQEVISNLASNIGDSFNKKLSDAFSSVADDIENELTDDNRYSEYGTDVITVANKFSGGGYKWGGVSGVCIALFHNGKLCVAALKNIGIGYEVSLEDAKEGDFCQIWRTNGSGHSVIFISHIYDGDNIIGFNYRSSQKSTNGIGDTKEYYSDSGKGSMDRKYTYFGRMNS